MSQGQGMVGAGPGQPIAQVEPKALHSEVLDKKLIDIQNMARDNNERLCAMRNRFLGQPPQATAEDTTRPSREGMIGQLQDQADSIYEILGEQVYLVSELEKI